MQAFMYLHPVWGQMLIHSIIPNFEFAALIQECFSE